jgi:hypothetical protein
MRQPLLPIQHCSLFRQPAGKWLAGTAEIRPCGKTPQGERLAYYVVGPEVIRIIDIDPGGVNEAGSAAVGSAFGQATTAGVANTFTSASLRTSVFGLEGSPTGYP